MLAMGFIENTKVNGPGSRCMIHFQGCHGMGGGDKGCSGCWNTASHAFDTSKATTLDYIKSWIMARTDVEGITFSGGEPMQQAQYLYLLADFIKANKPDWSILMFTGYTLKELEEGKFKWKQESNGDWRVGSPELWSAIRPNLDVIVAGRYNESKRTADLPLRGSSNQEVIFLSSRYSEADLTPQEFEFNIANDGLVKLTGFPIGVDIDGLFGVSKQEVFATVPDENDGDDGILVGA